jgi:hypothetical protein
VSRAEAAIVGLRHLGNYEAPTSCQKGA